MTSPVAALRRFVRPRETEERCDTCGDPLASSHSHTFDPASHRIRCACPACVILYSPVHRAIPNRVRALRNFYITDSRWDELMIPVSLAFFTDSTPAKRTVALYPGPSGATESILNLVAWDGICADNPELREMEPDIEALLVNRVGSARQYFIVPIDECYKLVGMIRRRWRGVSGGAAVWGEIKNFFDEMNGRDSVCLP